MESFRQQPNRLRKSLLRARRKANTEAILIRRPGKESPSRSNASALPLRAQQNRLHIDRPPPSAPDIKSALGNRKLQLITQEILPQRTHGNLLQTQVRRPQTREVLLEDPILQHLGQRQVAAALR